MKSNLATQAEIKTASREEAQKFLRLCALAKPPRALALLLVGVRNGRLVLGYRDRLFSGYQKIGPFGYADAPTVAVPFSVFSGAIKTAGESFALHWDKKTLTVESGDGRLTLPVVEGTGDLPGDLVPTTFWVPSLFFLEGLPAMLRIASTDSPRNYGTVVRFECENGTGRLVATDGFRLAHSEHQGMPHAEALHGLAMPFLSCQQLLHLAKSGEALHFGVSEDKTTLAVQAGESVAYFRASAVQYPNYKAILPKTTRGQTIVVKELLATVKRALLGSDKSKALSIIAKNGKMIVRAKHATDGDFRVCVALDLPGHFDLGGLEFCLNGKFLCDTLAAAKEKTGSVAFPEDPEHPVNFTIGAVSTVVVPILMNKK